jgi:hypothetical protein
MKRMSLAVITATILSICYMVGIAESQAVAPSGTVASPAPVTTTIAPLKFQHGDCSWVPELAVKAGWKSNQIPKLIHIIKRESGCCPTRIGGSAVDENCNIVKMLTMSHPSDSGLLQINGVHWKKDHAQYAGLVCKQMKICSQEPLLDAYTNLKAGKLLFDVAGWSPWSVN